MKHRDTKTGKKLTDSVMCGTISSYWYCSNSNILRIWVLEAEKSEVGTLKQNFLKKQEKRHITHRGIKIRMAANFNQKQCKWENIGTERTEKKIVDLPLYTQGKYFSKQRQTF